MHRFPNIVTFLVVILVFSLKSKVSAWSGAYAHWGAYTPQNVTRATPSR